MYYTVKIVSIQGQQLRFRQKADSFCLDVTYYRDSATFYLQDYNSWVKYQRTYTDQDFGKEIHRKADLYDLCCHFKLVSFIQGEEAQKETECPSPKFYVFGTVVMNEGKKCYKIDSEGRITLYTNYVNLSQNRQEYYESSLRLHKVGDFSPVERVETRAALDKEEITYKFQKQIKELKEKLKVMTLINRQTAYYWSFYKTMGTKVTRKGHMSWVQLVFTEEILQGQVYSFRIKVVKSHSKQIMFGINTLDQWENQYSHSTGHAILYYGLNGYKYGEKAIEGPGFGAGDVVETTVDRVLGTIEWSVGGKVRAKSTLAVLLTDVVYLPHVETNQPGDCIEWIDSEYRSRQ